jgi:hypothetical protein
MCVEHQEKAVAELDLGVPEEGPWCVILYDAVLRDVHAMWCSMMLCHVVHVFCTAVQCCAMLYDAVQCYVVLCGAVHCCVML